MHPAPAFAWNDEAAMRAFVAEVAFAHLFVAAPVADVRGVVAGLDGIGRSAIAASVAQANEARA